MEPPEPQGSDIRWEWATDARASTVAPWLRVGPGDSGVLHRTAVHLIRQRESVEHRNLDWAFRPLREVADEVIAQTSPATGEDLLRMTRQVLVSLEAAGVAERDAAGLSNERWRATRYAVRALDLAYAERHPLTSEQP